MSGRYTYELTGIDNETGVRSYCVYNPSFVPIAHECSWRVARKIADLYNADVEWRQHTKSIRDELKRYVRENGAL